MNADQLKHYADKLDYEIDSWDLKVALDAREAVVVVDARSPESFAESTSLARSISRTG